MAFFIGVPTKPLSHIERRPIAAAAFPTVKSLAQFVSEVRSFRRNAMTFEVGVAEIPRHLEVILRSYLEVKSPEYRPDR
jgi:hypothetical protein